MTTQEIEEEIQLYADRLVELIEELGSRSHNPVWGYHLTRCLSLKAREIKYMIAEVKRVIELMRKYSPDNQNRRRKPVQEARLPGLLRKLVVR